jgi:hypothetical protein
MENKILAIDSVTDNALRSKVLVLSGREVKINFNLSMWMASNFQRLKDTTQDSKELFRNLISKVAIISDFTQEDYHNLDDNDLQLIAKEMISSWGSGYENKHNLYEEVFSIIDGRITQLSRGVAESLKIIIPSFEYALKPLQQNLGNMKRLSSSFYTDFGKIMSPVIANIQSMSYEWTKSVNNVVKYLDVYISLLDKASMIASKYDWFITDDSTVSVVMLEKIIEIEDKMPTQNQFDELFLGIFSRENINQLLDGLLEMNIAKDFSQIINEIKLGFNDKHYFLVIPAIFLTIEGLIVRGENHKGKMSGGKYIEFIDDIFSGRSREGLKVIIKQRMLMLFKHGEDIESPISRHAIMHGADTVYGTEANSIRLILILNEVACAFEYRDLEN